MIFGYRCPDDHEIEESFPIGHAPATVMCYLHAHTAHRVYEAPHICEDRLRFYRSGNPAAPSPRWSWSLGADMPSSRQERRIIEKTRGIEFVGRDEKPQPPAEPKAPEKGWLKREIDKRGIRFGSGGDFRPLSREESERKLKAERPEWVESEATHGKRSLSGAARKAERLDANENA